MKNQKGKSTDSPLEPPEATPLRCPIDFILVTQIWDSDSPTVNNKPVLPASEIVAMCYSIIM